MKRIAKSMLYIYIIMLIVCQSAIDMAHAVPNTFEAGSATLPATTGNTFTRIDFVTQFAADTTPNVFTMTTEQGDDPCTLRIRDVDETGFYAVCLEPSSEDGVHPGMIFDYIAIADGVTTVPQVGGGGDVIFESGCIETTTQQYGRPAICTTCSGPEGYDPVGFTSSFTNQPALLTQIQTTANLLTPGGDPSFIDTAIQSGSLTADGFNVAVDQMEAGQGPLANDERICYLAAERDGCQELDLSTFGGPSSVVFEAVNGGNVDGHNNGCNGSGGAPPLEGASFSGGCFSDTPIALAKQRSLNGGNGGFLRRCSVNANEIVLTYDEDTVSDAERNHVDELVSVFAFGSTFTTPVTLTMARVSQLGRKTSFEWQTSAESFHLGFYIWGELGGEWVQLNKALIQSDGRDSDDIKDYQHTLRLTRNQASKIQNFGISSMDSSGYEEFYGPFQVGEEYGTQTINEAIDWNETRDLFESTMSAQGYHLINGKWRKLARKSQLKISNRELGVNQTIFDVEVAQSGLHRVKYEDLSALSDLWDGVSISRIALTLNGEAKPRHIISDDAHFNVGDEIIFVGSLPVGHDSTYLNNYHYQLRIDQNRAVDPTYYDATPDPDLAVSTQADLALTLTEQKLYSAIIQDTESWADTQLLSIGNPVSKSYIFEFPTEIDRTAGGTLKVKIHGAVDFPGDPESQADHHMQIHLNDQLIADVLFDGIKPYIAEFTISDNQLTQHDNVLRISLPGDTGHPADIVIIDDLEISTKVDLINESNYDFPADTSANSYRLNIPGATAKTRVYAYHTRGALSLLENTELGDQTITFAGLPNQEQNKPYQIRYSVDRDGQWHQAKDISISQPKDLHSENADYLIVAHPNFINDALSAFAEQKEQQGHTVNVINWLDIVATYGFGNNTPAALNRLLSKITNGGVELRNLLLVGGHTYDYRNRLQSETVNFIPAHYRTVGVIGNAPTDNPYADLNKDNLPEFAIGRWPVRTADDLEIIIKKTDDWSDNIRSQQYQSALLIAQQRDNRNLDFESQLDGRVGLSLSQLNEFETIERVYLQQLVNSGETEPISAARTAISDALNQGTNLISFAGHASTSAWGLQSIVNTDFINNLQNTGRPTVVMPLACYTTYYENPNTNSLAHQWLFAGDIGGVAIHGASVLGEYRENGVFAERYMTEAKSADTIGEAILRAKQQLAPVNEMLHNWVLLGDPSLPIR